MKPLSSKQVEAGDIRSLQGNRDLVSDHLTAVVDDRFIDYDDDRQNSWILACCALDTRLAKDRIYAEVRSNYCRGAEVR